MNSAGRYAAGFRFHQRLGVEAETTAAPAGYYQIVAAFTNGPLVERVRAPLNAAYTSRQATCSLGRFKRKGLNVKISPTHIAINSPDSSAGS